MANSSQKLQRNIAVAIVLAETTHVFCCVLPTIVTVLALLASLGAVTHVPAFMLELHEMLHHYEIPVIVFSGVMLGLGWGLYGVSRQSDCQKRFCDSHENNACAARKDRTGSVLAIASILFLINIMVYFALHRGSEDLLQRAPFPVHHQEH